MAFVYDPLGNVYNGAVVGLERANNGSWIDQGDGAAAPPATVTRLFPTSDVDVGGWAPYDNGIPIFGGVLWSAVDDLTNTQYIECVQGAGMSDECLMSFGTLASVKPATQVVVTYSTFAANPGTDGAAIMLIGRTASDTNLQGETPTIITNTFVERSYTLNGAALSLFNGMTSLRVKFTAASLMTNRIGYVYVDVTH